MAFEDLGHSAEVQDLNSYFDLVIDICLTLYKSDCLFFNTGVCAEKLDPAPFKVLRPEKT